jgi:hypothetical protein
MAISYGSNDKPVSLDMFQTIVEVKWRTSRLWRVDYTYRALARDAGTVTGSGLYFDASDSYMIEFNANTQAFHYTDGVQNNGSDILRGVREMTESPGPFTDEEKTLIAVVSSNITREGHYGYIGHTAGTEIWWIENPEDPIWTHVFTMGEVTATVSYPARRGVLFNGSQTFTTNNQTEVENLPNVINTWWADFQANLIANGASPEYREFEKGAHYEVNP